jgi:hypothetical protein
MKTTKLPRALPCPFCGQAAKVCRQPASLPERRATYWQCGCGDTHRTRLCAVHPLAFGHNPAEAITTWNSRAENCRRAPSRAGESDFRDLAGRTLQPIGWEMRVDGAPRVCFKKNAIVELLLATGRHDLNSLARMNFSDEDRAQFAQLIGYSVSGWGELSYVPLKVARIADDIANRLAEQEPLLVAAKRLTKGGAS